MDTFATTEDNARAATDGLAEAVAAAGYAPSIHDTQPWRWRLSGDILDLYLDRGRIPAGTDPDTRLATLSCGTALHHARTVLAAEGWRVRVDRMPDAADQDHLARLTVDGPAPAEPHAVRQVRTIPLRHTNRTPTTGAPIGSADLRAITDAVQAEGAWLRILKPNQVLELAAAAGQALQVEAVDPDWRAELAYWTEGDGDGSSRGDTAALFAILYGHSDEPRDWVRAGEGMSAGWLIAAERGLSVRPMGAPVEVSATRDTLRRLLDYLHHPYLVLRFGTGDHNDRAGQAPRLPADQTLTRD